MHDTTRLLTRHFSRRFIENDLISPDSDRHQTLAVAAAVVLSFNLVVTMLLSLKYLTALPTPGLVSLLSLDDKFLYIGWSMTVMALVTLAEWDTLALDRRDSEILGPLPLPGRTIFKAKALSLLVCAGGCVVVLNVVPTIVFSFAIVSKLVVGPMPFLAQVATHAVTTIAAGAFGFLSVLGLRELLHAILGAAVFRRVSTTLQVGLVVFFVTAFCLLPGLSDRVGRSYLAPEQMTFKMPPLWFLGVYETGAGHMMDDLSRNGIPRRLVPFDRAATQIYRSRKPLFHRLAGIAVSALGLVALVAAAGYTFNNRRLPSPVTAQRDLPHRLRRLLAIVAERVIVRDPIARAGFFFTVQALFRNSTHRLSMAVSVALGLAFTAVALHGVDVQQLFQKPRTLTGVLSVQGMVTLVLLAGFRHAARVPAELRANWAFQLCWSEQSPAYLDGVKRAAFLCVLCPVLLMFLPVHVFLLGPTLAFLHLLCGLAFANTALEVAMLGFHTVPFASGYAAGGNLKGWLALGMIGFWLITQIIASIERTVLGNISSVAIFVAGLMLLTLAVRVFDRRQRRSYGPTDFYELPEQTQRLDLTA